MVGTELAQTAPGDVVGLQDAAERARKYIAGSMAPATVRAYTSDLRQFSEWCAAYSLPVLPATPEIVALYVAELAETHKPATLTRRLSAISQAHQTAGYESPTQASAVRKTMAGIRRAKGTAPVAKAPLAVSDLRLIVTDHLPHDFRGRLTPKGSRDRALLLLGFAGAFRRSELVGLDCADVEHVAEGLIVTLRRSKTDQEGAGRKVGIPYGAETCPVRALEAWLQESSISDGPIFRPVDVWGNVAAARLSDHAVAVIVKRYAAAIGRDAATFAGHSLRAGFATAAAKAGAAERDIMNQTGHRSLTMLRRYIRDGSLFTRNAAASVGL
jgi:site-specific recombinase XerD